MTLNTTPAGQTPAVSRQAVAWMASLALQAGISAANATGAAAATDMICQRVIVHAPYGDLGLVLGTGGSASPEFFGASNHVGYRLGAVEVLVRDAERVNDLSPAQKLERVLDALKPSVTELASALGVSRQAIYAWKAGEPISEINLAKLDDLNRAADSFIEAGVTEPSRLVRRRYDGGRNLLDIVRDGGSANTTASALIGIIRREEAQRRALDVRLQGRPRVPIHGDDIGAPSLSEWS